MRSPALAIGWEFRRRHRWGLIAVAGYLFVVAMIRFLILEPGEPVLVDSGRFVALVSVPLTTTFVYLLAVFRFGFAGDLAARLFAVWPSGIEIPVIWPALLAAGLLAWTQALTWMPYGLPAIRLIVAVLCLAALDTVVLVAIHFKAGEPTMVAILGPQVPLAYLVARFAVARARRGDVPDTTSLRLGAPKCGSNGGGMAGRCRRSWVSCCRSSWRCCGSPRTRRLLSSKYCSSC